MPQRGFQLWQFGATKHPGRFESTLPWYLLPLSLDAPESPTMRNEPGRFIQAAGYISIAVAFADEEID
jgi:hypothetical protein